MTPKYPTKSEAKACPRPCTACRFCDWPAFATGDDAVVALTAMCFHPTILAHGPSPVTGLSHAMPCFNLRRIGASCGIDGTLFEDKEGVQP